MQDIRYRLLQKKFSDKDYEIIISEQDDTEKFRKNDLYNIAARDYSTGDVLIFHDVDYVPDDSVTYEIDDQPCYPCRRAIFLNEDNKPKELDEIPHGYRGFRNDVGDHSGGVFMMLREMWEKIGGLNPLYVGWGLEDDDTRERVKFHGYEWYRPAPEVGTFFVLPHEDNHPGYEDDHYMKNIEVANGFVGNLGYGYKDSKGVVEKFETDNDDLIWLKIKEK